MKCRHNLTNFFNGDTELVASLCNPQPREEGERAQTAQEEKRAILLGALRKYIRRRRRPRRSRLPLASLGGLRSGGGGLGSALGTN